MTEVEMSGQPVEDKKIYRTQANWIEIPLGQPFGITYRNLSYLNMRRTGTFKEFKRQLRDGGASSWGSNSDVIHFGVTNTGLKGEITLTHLMNVYGSRSYPIRYPSEADVPFGVDLHLKNIAEEQISRRSLQVAMSLGDNRYSAEIDYESIFIYEGRGSSFVFHWIDDRDKKRCVPAFYASDLRKIIFQVDEQPQNIDGVPNEESEVAKLNGLNEERFKKWLFARLHNPGIAQHKSLIEAYSKIDQDHKKCMSGVVLGFISDLAYDRSDWRENTQASEQLLQLAIDVLSHFRSFEKQDEWAIQILQDIAEDPRLMGKPGSSTPNLHRLSLEVLVSMWAPQDRYFWYRQHKIGGDSYAPVVIAGLANLHTEAALYWLTQIDWTPSVEEGITGLITTRINDGGHEFIQRDLKKLRPKLSPKEISILERLCQLHGIKI